MDNMIDNNQTEEDLTLKGFDMGEKRGGLQMIIASKQIAQADDSKEFCVFTIGNAPQFEMPENENAVTKETVGKQLYDKFMNVLHKKPVDQNKNETEEQKKLRCFMLVREASLKYRIKKEIVTPKGLIEAANYFKKDQEQPDISK